MKKYNYREYYKSGERIKLNGKVIEAAEDSCACKNCCFTNELFNVPCSLHCTGDERPDGLSVCFELADIAKENTKENAIYERFRYNGVVASAANVSYRFRAVIVYYSRVLPSLINVWGSFREDGTGVYYKRSDNVRS